MIIVYAALIFVGWCFIGDLICYAHTKWSMRTIYGEMKYTKESFMHEASRDVFMERGYIPREASTMDFCLNTIFWPNTLIRAHRGHKKFVKAHRSGSIGMTADDMENLNLNDSNHLKGKVG